MIVTDWGETTVAEVRRDTQVRYQGGVKSPILTQISKGDEVTIVEREENWKKVRTKDGFIGYVKNSALRDEETKEISRDFEEQEFTNISKDYTINMVWHNVTNSDANSGVLEMIAQTKGLTTIAPTWFHVADTDANLTSIASTEYVNYAHQSNIEVWAAIRDFDGGIDSYEESYEVLSHTSKRTKLINQLISEALRVGIDGINVDFERISEDCGEHFIQFIRELSVRCRQNGLVLSVDNYVPMGYNMQYDRKEQGIVADYVVIMGYDEHYAGSPEAGPVSSYDFVKNGIEATLEEVPAEKVISGIPFFTRLWQETPKTEEEIAAAAGTDEAEYTTNVTSEALGMTAAADTVAQAGVTATWDEDAQQNYATWEVEGVTYKIWLEDAESIEPKLKLMKGKRACRYGGMGVGTGKFGYLDSDPTVCKLNIEYLLWSYIYNKNDLQEVLFLQKIIRLALMLLLLAALALANTRLSEQTAESVQSSTKADEKREKGGHRRRPWGKGPGEGGRRRDPGKGSESADCEKNGRRTPENRCPGHLYPHGG